MTSIGIFDSGIGGLTVLKALKQKLPDESFVYLGDTARLPYGTKSPPTIRHYLTRNIDFLKSVGVKAIVVACNSASSVLAEDKWGDLPIYGVIRPGARKACEATRNLVVGILGTTATVQSGAYPKALKALDPSIRTVQQACPLLVPLVEEGWHRDDITRHVIARYLTAIMEADIDTLILGCTHYPVLKDLIRETVGPHITLVDSAEVVAAQVSDDIASGRIEVSQTSPAIEVWTTDAAPAFQEVGTKILEPITAGAWSLADI